MFFVKAIIIWFVMVLAAIVNGILRETVLDLYLGESLALPVSGILLSILILAITYMAIDWFAPRKTKNCLMLGLFWIFLTLMFEYGFGYFVRGMELAEINQVFNIRSGNLFALVVLVTLLGPLIISHIKANIRVNKEN